MRALLLALLVFGVIVAGCTQLGNNGSKDIPTAPPLPFFTAAPTATPTTTACIPEGQTLGAVVPGNTAECCSGLTPYGPDGIVGTRGTCIKLQNIPTATPTAAPTDSGSQPANPAATHCTNLGYAEAFQNEGTQCTFSDGSSCDEWDFYRGKCGEAFSACARSGGKLTAGSGRIGSAYFQFGLCTFADGSQCSESELASGTCQAGQCTSWTARGCRN